MGRKLLTDEQRVERLEPRTAAGLKMAFEMHRAAVETEAICREAMRQAILEALAAGASYRDIEALLGIPRASLNTLVIDGVRSTR